MAITDIPEFVPANPGDLITAKAWESMQQLTRSSLRLHQHDRPAGTPPTDSDTVDHAEQIGTAEIADGAITTAKLAPGAVTSAVIPDGAIGTAEIADLAVTTGKIANASVGSAKLAFGSVGSGSVTVPAGTTMDVQVALGLSTTKTGIYFPSLTLLLSSGAGLAQVTALIMYRQAVGQSTVDLYLRLSNNGGAQTFVIWQVHTFA
jgi:hypothetical protein